MKNIQYNRKNEIIKTQFFEMLEHAKGRDQKTINSHAKAIHEFEVSTGFGDFKQFNVKQAQYYKEHLTISEISAPENQFQSHTYETTPHTFDNSLNGY